MLKKLVLFLIFSLLFLLNPTTTFATQEFDTNYYIKYFVNRDTSITAEQKVSLTNKLSNIYATEYIFSIGATEIRDIKARDKKGAIQPEIKKDSNTTTVRLVFNDQVVGKNNTLEFTLWFTTNDFSSKNGNILEISVPKISQPEEVNNYQSELIVPYVFKEPAFIFPQPNKVYNSELGKIYFFDKERIIDTGVTSAFGEPQIFNFNLTYFLENPSVSPSISKIALPPDTPYQKVYYNTLVPEPETVEIDKDGNWLAVYALSSKQQMEVTATGSAEIYIRPRADVKDQIIDNQNSYISPQKYWQVNDEQIQTLAKNLKTPKKIYNYLVDNFIYDYGRIDANTQRFGAKKALENQDSLLCMEFTDLFIALARAAGIPAREVNGFAFTTNDKLRPLSLAQDILHAWPEYYDEEKNLWIPIDPTWGNTTGGVDFFNKLDLNHFAFAFHGLDSEFPLPAGSYKKSDAKEKNLQIDFGVAVKPVQNFDIAVNFPPEIFAGFSISGEIYLKSTGNVALESQEIYYSSKDFDLTEQKISTSLLPPYGRFSHKVILGRTSLFSSGTKTINIRTNNQEKKFEIIIKPFWQSKIVHLSLSLACGLLLFMLLIKITRRPKKKK